MQDAAHSECCNRVELTVFRAAPDFHAYWCCVMSYRNILNAVIILLIVHLQYRLWLGDGSIQQIRQYQARLDELALEVREKKERNDSLYGEVLDLRKGQEAIEERARYELGMIREDETFFHVLE